MNVEVQEFPRRATLCVAMARMRRVLAMVAWLVWALPATAEFTFEQYEVVTGSAKRQTVLPGFLLGGEIAELAVVSVAENGGRKLRIHALRDGVWERVFDKPLRPEVLFVDVANIDGRDRLITYERGRLNWFDPISETEHELVSVTSIYNAPLRDEIPRVDVSRDLNSDGRDDLVVPDFDGFWVFIQNDNGAFGNPVKLGPDSEMGMTVANNPWYQARPVHELDYDRDGRTDLVFWNEDHFEVHRQDAQGLFDQTAEIVNPDVAFESDGFYSISFGDSSDEENTKQKVLHSLSDLNGDSVADLVTFSLDGASLFSKQSTYEVHLGTPTPEGGTEFSPAVDTAIESGGIQFDLQQHDFDRDGKLDVMVTSVEFGIGKIIAALLTGSASLDLEFYRMEGHTYPDEPNVTRKITAEFDFSTGNTFVPSVLIADVNGDGRSDLLVQEDREELHVFVGVPGADLFARRPQKVAVTMPDDEEYTHMVDLNRDGKQDFLMHHRSTTEPHRVTMLIAR